MTDRTRNRLLDMVTSAERRRAYEEAGFWTEERLVDRVAAHAAAAPDRVAVVDLDGGREVTYGNLDRDSNRLANLLLEAGVQPGDVVSVQLPNWYETVVVDLGVLKAGAVLNPLLPIYRANELRHVLGVGAVPVFFTPQSYRGFDHAALAAGLEEDLGALRRTITVPDPGEDGDGFRRLLERFDDSAPGIEVAAAAPSELIFTSGTEARPKAVMHSEQTTGFSVRTAAAALGMGPGDVVWMPSPIGHSTGFNYGVRIALHLGLPLVLQDRWSPAVAIDLVERHRCSYCVAATTFLSDLVAEAGAREADLGSLRLFSSGGASIPAELVTAAEEVGLPVLRLYGSTEVLVASWNRPESPRERRIGSDGLVLAGVELQVRGEDGATLVDEPGEIVVRGPNTSLGFFEDEERTKATFEPDGWVRSGDLGVLDANGYLTVIGRKKEIIIRGGLNIAPSEVEALIRRHPDVVDVAVVGVPDERLGERTCACLVLASGASLGLQALVDFLTGEGLATFKLPERLRVVEALPKTSTGKVQKFELVELLGRDPDGG